MKTNIYFRSYLASFFSDKSYIATLNIHFVFNKFFFLENRAVYDNAAKYFRRGGEATE